LDLMVVSNTGVAASNRTVCTDCWPKRRRRRCFILTVILPAVCVCALFFFVLRFPDGRDSTVTDFLRAGRFGVRTLGVARFSARFQTGTEDRPVSRTMGTGSLFQGWGHGVIDSTPSSAEVKERMEL